MSSLMTFHQVRTPQNQRPDLETGDHRSPTPFCPHQPLHLPPGRHPPEHEHQEMEFHANSNIDHITYTIKTYFIYVLVHIVLYIHIYIFYTYLSYVY